MEETNTSGVCDGSIISMSRWTNRSSFNHCVTKTTLAYVCHFKYWVFTVTVMPNCIHNNEFWTMCQERTVLQSVMWWDNCNGIYINNDYAVTVIHKLQKQLKSDLVQTFKFLLTPPPPKLPWYSKNSWQRKLIKISLLQQVVQSYIDTVVAAFGRLNARD